MSTCNRIKHLAADGYSDAYKAAGAVTVAAAVVSAGAYMYHHMRRNRGRRRIEEEKKKKKKKAETASHGDDRPTLVSPVHPHKNDPDTEQPDAESVIQTVVRLFSTALTDRTRFEKVLAATTETTTVMLSANAWFEELSECIRHNSIVGAWVRVPLTLRLADKYDNRCVVLGASTEYHVQLVHDPSHASSPDVVVAEEVAEADTKTGAETEAETEAETGEIGVLSAAAPVSRTLSTCHQIERDVLAKLRSHQLHCDGLRVTCNRLTGGDAFAEPPPHAGGIGDGIGIGISTNVDSGSSSAAADVAEMLGTSLSCTIASQLASDVLIPHRWHYDTPAEWFRHIYAQSVPHHHHTATLTADRVHATLQHGGYDMHGSGEEVDSDGSDSDIDSDTETDGISTRIIGEMAIIGTAVLSGDEQLVVLQQIVQSLSEEHQAISSFHNTAFYLLTQPARCSDTNVQLHARAAEYGIELTTSVVRVQPNTTRRRSSCGGAAAPDHPSPSHAPRVTMLEVVERC
jgi:hypothetical protein